MGVPMRRVSPGELRKLMDALDVRDYLRDLHELCKKNHATLEEVLAGSRIKHISRARRACILRMREDGLSFTSIAELLNLDSSAAIYAYKRATGGPPKKKRASA